MAKIVLNGNVVDLSSASQTNIEVDSTLIKAEDGIIGVTSPVQSILRKEDFEALSDEEQTKGLYVIKKGGNKNVADSLVLNGQSISLPSSIATSVGSSNLKLVSIILLADNWDENSRQTIPVPEILEDETTQLITPVPSSDSFDDYYTSDIRLVAQSEGLLTFEAIDKIPEVDCVVNIYIQEISYEEIEPEVNYIWWSPKMTSDTTPDPYAVTASSIYSNYYTYYGIDGNNNSFFHAGDADPWYMFDYGSKMCIKGIRFYPRSSYAVQLPNTFIFEGSNDGESFEEIYVSTSQGENVDGFYTYEFEKSYSYRYFRLSHMKSLDNRGPITVAFAELQFLRPESEVGL